jgi:hypothetical protein
LGTGVEVSLAYGPPETVLEYTLYPVTVEVLGAQVSEAECETTAAPVPDSVITIGEFTALLVTEMLPVTVPAVDGSNVALKVAVCPPDRINPAVPLVVLNPAPVTTTFEIVTMEFPELVSVTLLVTLFKTVTVPKARLVELLLNWELGELTVKTAAVLVALPAVLPTTTVNCAALSETVVAGVV